jgi:hypothetical protein
MTFFMEIEKKILKFVGRQKRLRLVKAISEQKGKCWREQYLIILQSYSNIALQEDSRSCPGYKFKGEIPSNSYTIK